MIHPLILRSVLFTFTTVFLASCYKFPVHSGYYKTGELAFPVDFVDHPLLVIDEHVVMEEVPYTPDENVEYQRDLRAVYNSTRKGERRTLREQEMQVRTLQVDNIARRADIELIWVKKDSLENYPVDKYPYIVSRFPFYDAITTTTSHSTGAVSSNTKYTKTYLYHLCDRKSKIHYQDMIDGKPVHMIRRLRDAKKVIKRQARRQGIPLNEVSSNTAFRTMLETDRRLYGMSHEGKRKIPQKILKFTLLYGLITVAVNGFIILVITAFE